MKREGTISFFWICRVRSPSTYLPCGSRRLTAYLVPLTWFALIGWVQSAVNSPTTNTSSPCTICKSLGETLKPMVIRVFFQCCELGGLGIIFKRHGQFWLQVKEESRKSLQPHYILAISIFFFLKYGNFGWFLPKKSFISVAAPLLLSPSGKNLPYFILFFKCWW